MPEAKRAVAGLGKDVLSVTLVDGDVALVVVFVLLYLDAAVESMVGVVSAVEAMVEVGEDREVIADMLDRLERAGHLVVTGRHLRMEIGWVHPKGRTSSEKSHRAFYGG